MDAVGTPSSVLVVGGTSDIGLAVVERLGTGTRLRVVLAARPSPRRNTAVQRLTGAGHEVAVVDFDAEDTSSHAATVSQAFAGGDLDVVVVAVGLLGDQERAWQDQAAAVRLLQVNATAAVSTGVLVAERLRQQGHGTVVALSSVAAERARRSNFVYGAGKAAMDAFYTGLREALRADGIRVLVVRPGFVRSRMTEGLAAVPLSKRPPRWSPSGWRGRWSSGARWCGCRRRSGRSWPSCGRCRRRCSAACRSRGVRSRRRARACTPKGR